MVLLKIRKRSVKGEDMVFPILETERLILREITKDDAEAVFACFFITKIP